MFTGFAAGEVCDVSYRQRTERGEEPIDRYTARGYEGRWDAPKSVSLIGKKQSAFTTGRRLCRKLDASDVRLYARCAHRKGWRVVAAGEDNLCER